MPDRARLAALTFAIATGSLSGCADHDAKSATKYFAREQLLDAETCRGCHSDHYREWAGSMHAYASQDPVFLAMNRRGQEETQGELGAFCVGCHAPLALREGATTDGLNLDQVPKALQGVTCYFCHNVDAVEGTHDNPLHLSGDVTMRGGIRDARQNSAHASEFSELLASPRTESAAPGAHLRAMASIDLLATASRRRNSGAVVQRLPHAADDGRTDRRPPGRGRSATLTPRAHVRGRGRGAWRLSRHWRR
jgi:hypothetical protein